MVGMVIGGGLVGIATVMVEVGGTGVGGTAVGGNAGASVALHMETKTIARMSTII